MAAGKPTYGFEDFVSACAKGKSTAFVSKGAMLDAARDFNLQTQDAILGFVGSGGLASPKFQNTAEWRNNKDTSVTIMADAYGFFAGSIYGYIAFCFSPSTGKWIIKSLKKNIDPDPRASLSAFGSKLVGGKP